jgi:hypothetical protein
MIGGMMESRSGYVAAFSLILSSRARDCFFVYLFSVPARFHNCRYFLVILLVSSMYIVEDQVMKARR